MGFFEDNAPDNPLIDHKPMVGVAAAPSVTTGQQGLPRDASAVNQNPIFAPGTNIVPGQDIPLGTMTPAPAAAASGPPTGPMDDAAILAQIKQWAAMPGADPSLGNDPQYWLTQIKAKGGLSPDNLKYWQDASVGPTAFFNNPNRESGGSSLGALGAQPYSGGFGGMVAPYTQNFSAPTAAQAEAQPGYQFARDQGLQAIDRSAAAKGTLLTGGNLKDLSTFAGGIASQNYNNVYNQNANTFGINRDIAYRNQDAPFNKLYNLSALGRPTVP